MGGESLKAKAFDGPVRDLSISETCYRYEAKLSSENEQIAEWLIRVTENQRNWGFGLCFPVSSQRERLRLESQARVPHLLRTGVESSD